MKPEDRKRLKQHIEMIVEHKIPSNVVFCPNCEKDTECIHTAELYECKECGEDFAKYIVSRKPANSDVSMTQDVLMDIKTGQSIENANPDYYKQEIDRLTSELAELRTLLMESYRRFRFVGLNKNGTLMKKLLSVLGEDAETSYNAYLGGELASDGLLKRLE